MNFPENLSPRQLHQLLSEWTNGNLKRMEISLSRNFAVCFFRSPQDAVLVLLFLKNDPLFEVIKLTFSSLIVSFSECSSSVWVSIQIWRHWL
jgi:hypothetical protein